MQLSPALVLGVWPGSPALPLLGPLLLNCNRRVALLRSCLHHDSPQTVIKNVHSDSTPAPASALVNVGTWSLEFPALPHPPHNAASPLPLSPSPVIPHPLPATNATNATHPVCLINRGFTNPTAAACPSNIRLYGTGSGAAAGGGGKADGVPHELLASKCRVLPFSLSRDEAEAERRRHHEGLFTRQPLSASSLKASLLPFWCIGTEAHVVLHSAQIGRDYLVSRYNSATRRYEPRWETSWVGVAPHWRYSRRWGADAAETQVYGGSKYRHDPALARMKPGEYVRQAFAYDDYVRRAAAAPEREQPERMLPFRLGPEEAVEAARGAIRDAELRNAEQQLLRTYGGDRVRQVVMDVQLNGLTATPVFAPVFVFKTRIRGATVRTYVAGFRGGLTSGPVLPNPVRVAAAAAAAGPVALLASGALGGSGWVASLLVGVALPYLLGYGVASFWPELHAGFLRLRARLQRPLPDAAPEEQERWWRQEWVRQDTDDYSQGYSYSDEGRYSHSYSRRGSGGGDTGTGGGEAGARGPGGRAAAGGAGGGRSPDPRGYYATLGLSPDSGTEDVQAAFRAAALKWHPDREPDPSRKAESTRRFQAAQEAYSVLRDPHRRAAYDRGLV